VRTRTSEKLIRHTKRSPFAISRLHHILFAFHKIQAQKIVAET
jgi:hypothetical protein